MTETLLSFEVDGEHLTIAANLAGLKRLRILLERLEYAAGQGMNEDAHLFAETWGGQDLHETSIYGSGEPIKQVDFRVLLEAPPNNALECSRDR
jgi:hypothetical protein